MTLTSEQFRQLLHQDREAACRQVLEHAVAQWLDEGRAEVVRVLTVSATRSAGDDSTPRLDLGDDAALLEHAEHYGVVHDPDADAEPE